MPLLVMSAMEDLAEYVKGLISLERVGGRVQRLGPNRLLVHDCMHWPQSFTDSVNRVSPEVSVDVCSNRLSLSGFTVGLTMRRRESIDLLLYGVVAGGLACCVYIISTSPWWGAYRLVSDI